MNTNVALRQEPAAPELLAIIDRALQSEVPIERMERLYELYETAETRRQEREFSAALVAAQADIPTVIADASNPQTRSRYATLAAIYRAVQPILAAHGLGLSFNTEPSGDPGTNRVVCLITHANGYSRRHQIDVPVDTKGARGGDVMTKIHAVGSSVSYAKRYLILMILNIAVDDDDDGNRAGGHRPPPRAQNQTPIYRPPAQANVPTKEAQDPQTGEVIVVAEPAKIEMEATDDFRSWGEKFVGCLRHYPRSIEEVDPWVQLNQDELLRMRENKPQLFKTLSDAMDTIKLTFTSGT